MIQPVVHVAQKVSALLVVVLLLLVQVIQLVVRARVRVRAVMLGQVRLASLLVCLQRCEREGGGEGRCGTGVRCLQACRLQRTPHLHSHSFLHLHLHLLEELGRHPAYHHCQKQQQQHRQLRWQ